MAESLAANGRAASLICRYPRVRLSTERAKIYERRLSALMDEFMAEDPNPSGTVYSLAGALFCRATIRAGSTNDR